MRRPGRTAERRPTSSSRTLLRCCPYITAPAPTSRHDDGERAPSRERVVSRPSAADLVTGAPIVTSGAAYAVLAVPPRADRRRHHHARLSAARTSPRRLPRLHDDGERAPSRERVGSRSSTAGLVVGTPIITSCAACAVPAARPGADRCRHRSFFSAARASPCQRPRADTMTASERRASRASFSAVRSRPRREHAGPSAGRRVRRAGRAAERRPAPTRPAPSPNSLPIAAPAPRANTTTASKHRAASASRLDRAPPTQSPALRSFRRGRMCSVSRAAERRPTSPRPAPLLLSPPIAAPAPRARKTTASELRSVSEPPLLVVPSTVPCARRPPVAPRVHCPSRRAACAGALPTRFACYCRFASPRPLKSKADTMKSGAPLRPTGVGALDRAADTVRRASVAPSKRRRARYWICLLSRDSLLTLGARARPTTPSVAARNRPPIHRPATTRSLASLAEATVTPGLRLDSQLTCRSFSSNHSNTSRRKAPTTPPTNVRWSPVVVSTWWSPVSGRSPVARPSGLLVVHRTRRSHFEMRQALADAVRILFATEFHMRHMTQMASFGE